MTVVVSYNAVYDSVSFNRGKTAFTSCA